MRKIVLACSIVMLSVGGANAGEVKVEWQSPEKFTDIRPANDTRKKYRERLITHFDKFFAELAAKLPEGYKWQLTITDVDLAGDIDPFIAGAGREIRVVKDIYSPAMRFNYSLHDAHGEQVAGGEEKLRDMGFMHSLRTYNDNDEFRYEQQMLEDWFNKELMPKVEAAQTALPKVST